MTKSDRVRVRRVYDAPEPDDGARVLVDRLWPRGLAKEDAHLDDWAKDAAPSPELRRWYGHAPERYEQFGERYRAELAEPPARDAVDRLRERVAEGRLTLLTAVRDLSQGHARLLAEVVRSS
ncbi:DUF488 domain-containing protein [Streptomyces palmae]|uniref:DUF488 family protein n=1 Tax=Streptomyces palmae TaxID=1701085 RepID=A0A4Z0HFZ4_9ACTN|nr:DUF488 family protein [Streptomyces palmae]TGB14271.1 DUF488 family protein [Streptomyces palmae]